MSAVVVMLRHRNVFAGLEKCESTFDLNKVPRNVNDDDVRLLARHPEDVRDKTHTATVASARPPI
jgi:hypothetical protein